MPYEQYYYRFATRDEVSPIGRFRTALPPDSNQPVRFAFFSCQDFTFGYFNAHAVLAKEDIDFVVCLGDYIYAEDYYSVGSPSGGVRDDPVGHVGDARSVPGQVRRPTAPTRACGKMHGSFPMIYIWDDHEVQDNYAGRPSDGGLDPALPTASRARRPAYQAYFESMPTFGAKTGSQRIYGASALRPQRGPGAARPRSTATTSPAAIPFLGPACAGARRSAQVPRAATR